MIVRHEISLLDGTSALSGSSANERAFFDPAKYSGSLTYRFEVEISAFTSSGTLSVMSDPATGALHMTINPINGTGVFSTTTVTNAFVSGGNNLGIYSASGSFTVKSAKLIIFQDTGTSALTASQSQLEIGNRELAKTAATSNTYAFLAAPKNWLYLSDSWDGGCTFDAEVVWARKSSTMNTVTLGLFKSTDGGANWALDTTIVSAAAPSLNAIQRNRASFTPTQGALYRMGWQLSGTTSQIDVYCARVVVTQVEQGQIGSIGTGSSASMSAGLTYKGYGEAFTGTGITLSKATFRIYRAGTLTGNVDCKLYATTGTVGTNAKPTGAAIETASVTASSIPTTEGNISFTFSGTNTLTNGTVYVLSVEYNGGDALNNILVVQSGSDVDSTKNRCLYDGASWTGDNTFDVYFKVNDGEITKLEEQYLLANTALAAGTALQNFLSGWDPAEWSGVDNAYVHQVDSSSGNTSVVEIDTAGGTQVSGSVVTSPSIVMLGDLDDNYPSSNNNTSTQLGTGGAKQLGQSFTAGISAPLTAATFYLRKVGSPTGTMVAKLYSHSGTYGTSSQPGTLLATSNTWDVSRGTAAFSLVTFYFSTPYTMTSGTNYVIVLETTSGDGATNFIESALDSTSPTHSGNASTSTDLVSYATYSGYDVIFYTYTGMVMPTAQNLDVKATTNSGSLYGSRIVVYITKTATTTTTSTTTTTTVAGGRAYTFVVIC